MNIRDDPRRPLLNDYLVTIRDAFRLQAWTVEVGDHPPEDAGANLSVETQPDIWWAPIYVSDAFWDGTPNEQRRDVVHEMVHVVEANMWHWINHGIWRLSIAPDVRHAVEELYRFEMEKVTFALAQLLESQMPLPPEFPNP